MGNLGGSEILVILLIGLLVLGPTRLPELTRQIGRVLREVRKVTTGFQEELRAAVEDPIVEAEARIRGAVLTSDTDENRGTDAQSENFGSKEQSEPTGSNGTKFEKTTQEDD